MLLIFEQN